MIVRDAPNCGVTYDRHYDNRNSFIIQAIGGSPGGSTGRGAQENGAEGCEGGCVEELDMGTSVVA
jgi:hypothetical protein